MQSITLVNLLKMLSKGCQQVIENKEKINAINIFPIADKDTGSNLANTLSGIQKILAVKSFDNTDGLVDKILNAVLTSSQGNSGMIMASFLNGFLTALKGKAEFSPEDFAKALQIGAKNARAAVDNPVKGTMTDTINSFALAMTINQTNFSKTFYEATQKVRSTLINTENQMQLLKDSHVVDAGALGFTLFVYGMYEGLSGKNLSLTGIDMTPVSETTLESTKFPFEIMFTISNPAFSTKQLKEMFHQTGDSLDIIKVLDKIKVHIHTNTPEVVREMALLTGEILKLQVVDMRLEQTTHNL